MFIYKEKNVDFGYVAERLSQNFAAVARWENAQARNLTNIFMAVERELEFYNALSFFLEVDNAETWRAVGNQMVFFRYLSEITRSLVRETKVIRKIAGS